MKLEYLLEESYEELKKSISKNFSNYCLDEEWITDYFANTVYKRESNFEINNLTLLTEKTEEQIPNIDFANAILLYETIKLNPNQASNPFLWTYLTHTLGWKYMRKRWPITSEETKSRINERYFCDNKRISLMRNGLSRLWWAAHMTIDYSRKNKWELTKVLFESEDLFVGIMERDYSLCKNVTLGILSGSKKYLDRYGKLPSIETRREFLRMINRKGSVTLLDLATMEEIEEQTFTFFMNSN